MSINQFAYSRHTSDVSVFHTYDITLAFFWRPQSNFIIRKSLVLDYRIINPATLEHSYDGLLWTLQNLLRLSLSMVFTSPSVKSSLKSAFPLKRLAMVGK